MKFEDWRELDSLINHITRFIVIAILVVTISKCSFVNIIMDQFAWHLCEKTGLAEIEPVNAYTIEEVR